MSARAQWLHLRGCAAITPGRARDPAHDREQHGKAQDSIHAHCRFQSGSVACASRKPACPPPAALQLVAQSDFFCCSLTGVTTGISAHDRALTSRKLADPSCRPQDFNRPGHVVPLRARSGGVLERRGHTEAAVGACHVQVKGGESLDCLVTLLLSPLADLVRLSGLEGPSVGVICELLKPDDPTGSMARRDDCFAFAKAHNLKMISIEQLAAYRQRHNL